MATNTQLGVKQEVTYGTAVTPNHFYPLLSENPQINKIPLISNSRYANALFPRKNANIPITGGSRGDIVLPMYNRGLGIFLKNILGAGAVTGPADTTAYTQTFTVATLSGLGLTVQVNRPFHTSGNQPFTWAGGKVISWSIEVTVGNEATLTLTMDFDSETDQTALATASYPTDLELLSWAQAASSLAVAGTPVPCTSWKLSGDNGLKQDDPHIGDAHVEPVANAFRNIQFEFTGDYLDQTFYALNTATTNPGQYPGSPGMVFRLQSPSLITGAAATRPSLTVTVPAARIDTLAINNSDLEPTMQTVTGTCTDDGSSSPITFAYVTADSTI